MGSPRLLRSKARPQIPIATDFLEYSVEKDIIDSGIPFNCYGWDRRTALTGAMVILFLRNPVGVELELRGVEGVPLDQGDWDQVRVRIGLRSPRLESSLESTGGRRLTFMRPSRPAVQSRIEVAFIALTGAEESLAPSKFRLERVRGLDRNDMQR